MHLAILSSFVLLAQKDEPTGGGPLGMLLPLLAIGFLFYFLMIRPQKREQAGRKAMLAGLKKNDHVVTIGGIYGVVTNIHPEADEATIKVDEATNTKLRITLGSIGRVVGEEPPGDKPSK